MRSLDDVDWGSLEDAYGPAVEVPHQVRALASADPDEALGGLNGLGAGIFHQGSYYSATAPAIPFIVDAVAPATPPVKAEIALFLADMAAVHAAPQVAYEPWVFRSTPGAPDYPEAVATIEAVRAARDTYATWLDADEPTLRAAAAFLTSGLDANIADTLTARLAVETEPDVRATLLLALVGLGRDVDGAARSALEAECLAAARAMNDRALDGDVTLLEALAARPDVERTRLPFFHGDLCALACTAMKALARSRKAEVFAAARRALAERLARGERPADPPTSMSRRVSDPYPAPPLERWDYRKGAALSALANTMAALVFGERAHDPLPLRRDDLDASQRAVLSLTAEHGIPVAVQGAPWPTAATMRRFLTGGGPLDRELTLDGVTAPIVSHLSATENDLDANLARVARVGEALTPDECLDVIEDVLDGSYAVDGGTVISGHLLGRLLAFVEPHVDALAPRLEAYAARCAARMDDVWGEHARLALMTFERDRRAPPEAWDPLVAKSLAMDPKKRRAWLSAFPSARRASIATWLGNAWVLDQLAPACPAEEIERAILRRFLDPSCGWWVHDATHFVGRVKSVRRLRAARARADGLRGEVLDAVIRERTREGHYTLRLSRGKTSIGATLSDGKDRVLHRGKLPKAPRVPDLEGFVAALADRERAVVSLVGNVDRTTRYAIQRHLGDLGVAAIRDGSTTLKRAAGVRP